MQEDCRERGLRSGGDKADADEDDNDDFSLKNVLKKVREASSAGIVFNIRVSTMKLDTRIITLKCITVYLQSYALNCMMV